MESVSIRVLLADDEAAIRNGLRNAVPWENYHAQVIAAASNGQEALDMIDAYKPDIVIIDIKMPQIDGLEVIRRVKASGSSCRFLILSGYDDFSLAQKAIRYGANGYFLKPLNLEEFKAEFSHQCAEILSEHNSSSASANLDELIKSSRTFFFNQLLLNEVRSSSELDRRKKLLGLNIFDAPYRIAVCTAAASEDTLLPSLEQANTVFSSAFSKRQHELWIFSDKQLILLINEPSQDKNELTKLLSESIHSLKEQTGTRFYAAIGTLSDRIEQVSASYSAALRALSYHIYEVSGDVYDTDIICRQKPDFSVSSIAFDPMITCIEHNDRSEIRQCCSDFVRSLFFTHMPPPDFIRGMCIHVLTNIRIRFAAKHTDFVPEDAIRSDELLLCHSIEAIIDWLANGFYSLSDSYRRLRESSDPIIETAKEYISTHLNSNLKAKDVAATVNLSESYFTIYFKTKTGQNFRDYILNARTDLAKKLLSEHRLSISEIAYATGYQDYRSFSRAFKNVTGISPSDYQNR